ncbi:MAG: anaerobic carbon-monoxide dehydrogenase catalytic subunit [Elusimicrobia bacterium]|nr:anaerobic carbon-monoxide dehydrogenase catalytic subunit [Elusimicrobiota bacterium]
MDKATQEMKKVAEKKGITTIWERLQLQSPHCKFGISGLCCKNCNYGPCRIITKGGQKVIGVCGADEDVISARNLVRHIAAGSACHSDHGREIAKTLLLTGQGKAQGYRIKDEYKLKKLAEEYKIKTDNKSIEKIAVELAEKILSEYGQQEGELTLIQRAPEKQKKTWRENSLMPRGIDREVVEAMSRTHMGVDNDYKNLIMHGMRCALSDGWGGSMVATELTDVLFRSPKPVRAKVNLGVLKKNSVNIIIHGHVPLLSDMVAEASGDLSLQQLAKEKGAEGINLAGICCTANEILMRRGISVVGSVLQQELAIATGAVDLMLVDLQCILPSLPELTKCFHTKIVCSSPKARFPGMEYVEFREEEGLSIAKEIIKMAIENFPNRKEELINIPQETMDMVAGFSTENIFEILGGKYRGTYRPLNDGIISGRIRGVAGLVGCSNPKLLSGDTHIIMAKELIKHDVLIVETGCAALDCAREGLLTPEAAKKYAGKGLQEICEAVGIPPVLHLGSCVDNSRILTACCEMVKEGGIGNSLDELPVAGAAMEWYSEKAIAIGWYFVASGAPVIFGMPYHTVGSKNVMEFSTEGVEKITGGKWAFEPDPIKAAHLIIEYMNKKREALKLKPMMYE